jgi:hypothetical protein
VTTPQQKRNELARALDDDRVMTFRTWCEVNDFSEATGRRLRRDGKGPTFIQLSDRRVGVRVGDNRRWQQSRAQLA